MQERYYDVIDEMKVQDYEQYQYLKSLCFSDERIFAISYGRYYFATFFFIGSKFDVVDRMDIQGRIEETLHRMLDDDASDDRLFAVTGFEPEIDTINRGDDPEDNIYIDLGYLIPSDILQVVPVDRIPYCNPLAYVH